MTVWFPAVGAEKLRVEVAAPPDESLTALVLSFVVGPPGDTEVERLIVPENPFCPATVIVEVTVAPGTVEMLEGEAARVKSGLDPW